LQSKERRKGDEIASIVTARAAIINDGDAISIAGQSGFSGYSLPQPTPEQFMQQPAVRNLIRQSRHARAGLYLIAAGTFFQIIGAVPSFFPHY
jgi:hypothetical protein